MIGKLHVTKTARTEQLSQRAFVEKKQMRLIHVFVLEISTRNLYEKNAAGLQPRSHVSDESGRIARVLEHVRHHNEVCGSLHTTPSDRVA